MNRFKVYGGFATVSEGFYTYRVTVEADLKDKGGTGESREAHEHAEAQHKGS